MARAPANAHNTPAAHTSDGKERPNVAPLATKPPTRGFYLSSSLSNRREMIASTCNYINQISEYASGGTTNDVTLPGQSNTDERMPLTFLRPAATLLNSMISGHSLAVTPVPVPGYSLDHNGVVSLINNLLTTANAVNTALP